MNNFENKNSKSLEFGFSIDSECRETIVLLQEENYSLKNIKKFNLKRLRFRTFMCQPRLLLQKKGVESKNS